MGERKTLLILLSILISLLAVVPIVRASDEDSWIELKPMHTARIGLGVAVVDGKIYAIGGYNGRILGTNEMYDPENDTWTAKASMPTPRTSFGIAVYQNKIYTIGGINATGDTSSSKYTGVNEVYDPLTDKWETKEPMPTPRSSLDANVVDDKIYLIGGMKYGAAVPFNPDQYAYENQVYDPANDVWSTKTPIPNGTYGYASATVDTKIHFMGFLGSDIQVYHSQAGTWTSGTPSPTEVFDAAAGVTSGELAPKRICLIGGMYGVSNVAANVTQIYDTEIDAWASGASMLTPRWALGVAVVDDVLYAIGGKTEEGNSYSAANEAYLPVGYAGDFTPPDYVSPVITVDSSQNVTYATGDVGLVFAVDEETSWMGYCLDGEDNVTVTENTLSLTGLFNGVHNITVYATDTSGNTGKSETFTFTVDKPDPPPPSWMIILLTVTIVAVVLGSILMYFPKPTKKPQTNHISRLLAEDC